MYDVIVIGCGPAGMMASIVASEKKRVLVIEKNNIPGKKLLITGGGRCNVTNLKSNSDFLNNINHNRKYLYSTINNFGPTDIYNFFESNNIKLKEENNNKVFPVSNKSKDIVDCLTKLMKNVVINYNEEVKGININGLIKEVITNKNIYKCNNLIIATGGSSFKLTGSTGDNLNFAKMINQPITDIYPAEVSIILKDDLSFLAGTSIPHVKIKYMKYTSEGNLIFTHKGLSGESVMLMSEYVYLNKERNIYIDLLPKYTIEELKDKLNNYDKDAYLKSFLIEVFTKKFSEYLINVIGFNDKIKSLDNKKTEKIISIIKNFELEVKGTDILDNAYVTGGGIDLNYINTSTMESKINKGIYFVGEALDIHGPIGGYNITLALSTGYIAGSNIK